MGERADERGLIQFGNEAVMGGKMANGPESVRVPKEGLEPTLPEGKRILNPSRLPFRHFGSFLTVADRDGPSIANFGPPRRGSGRQPKDPWPGCRVRSA